MGCGILKDGTECDTSLILYRAIYSKSYLLKSAVMKTLYLVIDVHETFESWFDSKLHWYS